MARADHAAVLRALCDALIPALADGPEGARLSSASGSMLDATESVKRAVALLAPSRRRRFERLLSFVDHPLTTLVWLGRWRRFSHLSQEDATDLLRTWSKSRLSVVRRGFDVLKRIILLEAYGSESAVQKLWTSRGYPFVVTTDEGRVLGERTVPGACGTLVIGSGAGGAVAAAYLAEGGDDVVLLEKGNEVRLTSMNGVEATAMQAMFEEGGVLTTSDGAISLFAGSCLGGGTTVNWSASFRLPEAIRFSWESVHGIDWVMQDVFDQALKAVEKRTSVGVDKAKDNGPNEALRSGCGSLALSVKRVPRNTRGCDAEEARHCGRCGLGCALGRKQDMGRTYLRDFKQAGGRIVTGAKVLSILTDRGRVQGAEFQIDTPSGVETRRIKAERVLLAAGSIHTPAILLRSGLRHEQVGRNLHLHPTVGVAGRYPRMMRGWEGPVMSSFSDALAWLEGPWGVRIETPPIYPGLLASALPWDGPASHRGDLDLIDRTAAFIVLTRDRSAGTVVLDRDGNPSVRYRISDTDLAMMLTGVIEAARIHLAAGADSILFPHSDRKVLEAAHGEERIADLARDIFTWGWKPGLYPLFSAHQMGTCRMGGDSKRHPVDPEGRFRGVRGLYVSDASLFPEASGVNPALTIQAMSYCVARQVR